MLFYLTGTLALDSVIGNSLLFLAAGVVWESDGLFQVDDEGVGVGDLPLSFSDFFLYFVVYFFHLLYIFFHSG